MMINSTSTEYSLRAPQLGEGLTTVKIVNLVKQAGEFVHKDEVLYTLETDKTTTDIESPYSGRLVAWSVAIGDIVEVGEPVALILTEDNDHEMPKESPPPTGDKTPPAHRSTETTDHLPHTTADGVFIPPRMRAYCREQGMAAAEIANLKMAGKPLTPATIDHYLHDRQAPASTQAPWEIRPLCSRQQWLNAQFSRSQAQVIPATMVSGFNRSSFKKANHWLLQSHAESSSLQSGYLSELQLLAYWVSRVLADFPLFRSVLDDNTRRREYRSVNLGVAVQTESGELVTAVVKQADTLDLPTFIDELKTGIGKALQGEDQITNAVPLILSCTGGRTVLYGTPLLVAPATATLFVSLPDGEKNPANGQVYLSLTFDHRLINGMEAATFLDAIADKITHAATPGDCLSTDADKPVEERSLTAATLEALLVEKTAELLSVPVAGLDRQQSLGLSGLDSIKSVALKNYLEQQLAITLPTTLLWHYPTIQGLLDYLLSLANIQTLPATPDNPSAITEEDEMEQLLKELEALPKTRRNQLLTNLENSQVEKTNHSTESEN